VGAAIGFWVALTLAAPAAGPPQLASMRPINLNLPNLPPAPVAPPRPTWSNFQTPLPKPPPPPAWLRALFGDPNRPLPAGSMHSGHGGGRSFGTGHGFGGGHGHSGGCHGGGHR
jgi:uncharacterized membrane protein YgcG